MSADTNHSNIEFHTPVMVEEVISYLALKKEVPKIASKLPMYIDATVGGGGHAQAILDNLSRGIVVGLDCDADAIEHTKKRLARYPNFHLYQTNYTNIDKITERFPEHYLSGVLFDLGVSYHQIRTAHRGFTYRAQGPLDMRFNQTLPNKIAKDIIRYSSFKRLRKIFSEYGEERYAQKIAELIHSQRNDITNSKELANAIRAIIPAHKQNKTLARIFQSLRIAVNNELENIKIGLQKAVGLLAIGARIIVISYHSLEDRIVKQLFRNCVQLKTLNILTKKPLRPQDAEININVSARSARLRVAEKI